MHGIPTLRDWWRGTRTGIWWLATIAIVLGILGLLSIFFGE